MASDTLIDQEGRRGNQKVLSDGPDGTPLQNLKNYQISRALVCTPDKESRGAQNHFLHDMISSATVLRIRTSLY